MTPEHFGQMKQAMTRLVDENPIMGTLHGCFKKNGQKTIREFILECQEDDKENMAKWEVLHLCRVGEETGLQWQCHVLYEYLNDSHIQTALNKIDLDI